MLRRSQRHIYNCDNNHRSRRIGVLGIHTQTLHLAHSNSGNPQQPKQVYILSFDGVLADTLEWRTHSAMDVALDIWPNLQQHLNQDNQWFINKMKAVLPDTISSGPEGMSGIDAVLLARLLLEEQLLDGGKSNGCRGKYGGKYHPDYKDDNNDTEDDKTHHENLKQQQKASSSRPLTVGEIAANWNQGAYIKDTLRVKYHVNYKDPIPIIENAIYEYSQRTRLAKHPTKEYDRNITTVVTPKTNDLMVEAILDCQQHASIVILAGHETHIPWIQTMMIQEKGRMLKWDDYPNQITISTKDSKNSTSDNTSMDADSTDTDHTTDTHDLHTLSIQPHAITILAPTKKYTQHSQIIKAILSSLEDSTVHVLHSDITTLRHIKPLLMDVPRHTLGGVGGTTFSTCAVGKNVQLKLSLPSWPSTAINVASTTTSWQAQNEARMDAWLDTCDDFMDLVDVLSSQVLE